MTSAASLDRAQVIAWRNGLFVIFGLCGVALASWASRIPAVKQSLHASTSELGILILCVAIGSISGLIASSHVIALVGARHTILLSLLIGAVGFAVAGVGATVGPNRTVVIIGLIVFGTTFSICDVAMNLQGAVNERALGRATMPIFHAFFSFGTIIGAGLGALAEAARVPIALHLGAVAIVFGVGAISAVRSLRSETVVHEAAGPTPPTTWHDRLGIWRDPRTIVIGLIVLGTAFAEGSANDWLALAMVDGHGISRAGGALVYGMFVTAMTVGRLGGVRLLDRYGRVPVLRASAVLAAVGLVVLIFVPVLWIAVVGVVLWGLGASLGFPVGMSAAADDPKTAAARVSAVATIGYFAFLVGPPVIGFLGQQFGLLNALLIVLVLVGVAGISAGAARPAQPAR